MPEMTDHSAMPLTTPAGASTSAGCRHCHPHIHDHGCLGMHSCSAQLAAVMTLSVTTRVAELQPAPGPAALPCITTLAFDPPLRPPPA